MSTNLSQYGMLNMEDKLNILYQKYTRYFIIQIALFLSYSFGLSPTTHSHWKVSVYFRQVATILWQGHNM